MRLRFIAALALCLAPARSQPAFDVASVKAIPFEARTFNGMRHTATPTSLTMLHVSLGYIVRWAYDIPIHRAYELIGPDWFNPPGEFQFDVLAKTASPVDESQLRLMLRTLLAERFELAIHPEQRELPVYELSLARKTPALQEAAARADPKVKPLDRFTYSFEGFSMPQLAVQLGHPWTSRPVVDKTGLAGSFDFKLDIRRYVTDPETGKQVTDARGAIDMESAVIRGLRDQVGLALKPGRTAIDTLVVDRVLKVPKGN